MKSKTLSLKSKSGRAVMVALLALGMTGAGAFFAKSGPLPIPARQTLMETPGRELNSGNSNSAHSAMDSDVLDIAGRWTVTQKAPAGFTVSGGHRVPSGASSWTFRIRLTPIGPNSFGGQSFKGEQIDPASPVFFYGDTFYGGVGVQLVQMRSVEDTSAGRFYKLFCATHQVYERDPKRIEALGGWAYVGYPASAASPPTLSGYDGSFVMVKD